MGRITKQTTLHQAIKANPEASKTFDSYGMGCKSCSGARNETVEWGATMHGVDPDELVKKLNARSRPKKKGKK